MYRMKEGVHGESYGVILTSQETARCYQSGIKRSHWTVVCGVTSDINKMKGVVKN